MKNTLYTTILAALAATTSVQGVAIAYAQPTSTCAQPGQPCDLVARALAAFDSATAAASPQPEARDPAITTTGFCRAMFHSSRKASKQSCWGKAKRKANQTTYPFVEARDWSYTHPAGHAHQALRSIDDLALVLGASDIPAARGYYERLALHARAPAPSRSSSREKNTGFCREYRRHFGATEPCWGKRGEVEDPDGKDWDPESRAADKRWCAAEGEACHVAKRAAAAVLDVVQEKRHEEEEVEREGEGVAEPFDHAARVKRDPCFGAEAEYTRAARDLKAIEMVAMSIVNQQE